MINFSCECGAQISFDDRYCSRCQSRVGFAPAELRFYPIDQDGRSHSGNGSEESWVLCDNGLQHDACNWLRPEHAPGHLCYGCQFNRFIPNLSDADNISLWRTLETGKKRLLFSLMQLGLPLTSGWESPDSGLLFDFLQDQRKEGEDCSSFVTTGYLDGVITINVLEAEPISRIKQQQAAKEVYRTVLGHMRHESGHHFYQLVTADCGLRRDMDDIFGSDYSFPDYAQALEHYYQNGPPSDWVEKFISPYASAHLLEDWAETWGHYLHMFDTLQSASSFAGFAPDPSTLAFDEKMAAWQIVSKALNEMNRSMGMSDAYPFVLNPRVEEKLRFVEHAIENLKTR